MENTFKPAGVARLVIEGKLEKGVRSDVYVKAEKDETYPIYVMAAIVITWQKVDDSAKKPDEAPTSQRKCVIDGKRFVLTRHFERESPLSEIMTEIAIKRADRELGL